MSVCPRNAFDGDTFPGLARFAVKEALDKTPDKTAWQRWLLLLSPPETPRVRRCGSWPPPWQSCGKSGWRTLWKAHTHAQAGFPLMELPEKADSFLGNSQVQSRWRDKRTEFPRRLHRFPGSTQRVIHNRPCFQPHNLIPPFPHSTIQPFPTQSEGYGDRQVVTPGRRLCSTPIRE